MRIIHFTWYLKKDYVYLFMNLSKVNNQVNNYSINHHKVKCFRHEVNKGKGTAVKTEIEQATSDMFLIQDADLELSPSDIPRMLYTMNQLNVEFVNGSRYMQDIDRPLSSYTHYLANRFFTFLISILVIVKLTDMTYGCKLIHKNI